MEKAKFSYWMTKFVGLCLDLNLTQESPFRQERFKLFFQTATNFLGRCHPRWAPCHLDLSFFWPLSTYVAPGVVWDIPPHHRFQKMSAMYWTCCHLRVVYWSSLLNDPGGSLGLTFSSNRWLGIRVSRSWRSGEAFVMGPLFIIASASHNNVWSPSSSKTCSFSGVQSFAHRADHPFPASNIMGACWWVQTPLDALLLHSFVDLVCVPFFLNFSSVYANLKLVTLSE